MNSSKFTWDEGDVIIERAQPASKDVTVVWGEKYSEDQPRDELGRFASSDGGSSGSGGSGSTSSGGASGAQVDSLSKHTIGGKLSPERQALHDKLIADTLAGVPQSSNPTVYMMGGGPASGKSTVISNGLVQVPGEGKAAYINADDYKEKLPEYHSKSISTEQRARYVHEESSLISKEALRAAQGGGHDIVFDGTGNSSIDSLQAKVDGMRQNGHRVEANYVTLPTDLAVANAQARAEKTGRHVPEDIIRETHKSVSKVFPQAIERDLFDKVSLFDNTIKGSPKLVLSKEKGKPPTVYDPALYSAFLAKGK